MRKYIYITVLCLLISLEGMAQSLTVVKGKVMDASSKSPLVEVIVSSDYSSESVLTDDEGRFEIELKEGGAELRLSKLGYANRSFVITPRVEQEIYITLEDRAANAEDNLLMLDYTPDLSAFKKGAIYTDELLYGLIPGLQTVSKGGMPGEGTYLGLRGVRSFMSDNTPLIVIDGVIYSPDTRESNVYSNYSRNVLQNIAGKNVEKISFLRGYAAQSYGSLGINGVLIIDTETATDLETKVEFQTTNGVAFLQNTLPSLNAEDNRSYLFDIASPVFTPRAMEETFPFLFSSKEEIPEYFNDTKWSEEVYAPAFTTDNMLTIKGGDAIAKYAMTFGYTNQSGVQKNTGMERYYTRMNADMSVSPKVDLFANLALSYSKKQLGEQGTAQQTNPLLASVLKPSFMGPWQQDEHGNNLSVLDEVGVFGVSNPLAIVDLVEAEASMFDIMANLGLNYRVNSYLNGMVSLGMLYDYSRDDIFIPGTTSNTIAPLEGGMAKNTLRNANVRNANYYGNVTLAYSRLFGQHNVNAKFGAQFLYDDKEDSFMKGINTATDYDNTFTAVKEVYGRLLMGSGYSNLWLNSHLSAEYSWNSQLYVGGTLAVEKSTFDVKSGESVSLYPAASVAWDASNLPYIKNSSFFEKLVVRGEYVQSGNSRVAGMVGDKYYSGSNFITLAGIYPITLGEDALKRERFQSTSVGLELRGIGNRVGLSVDLYQELAKDLIVQRATPIHDGYQVSFMNSGRVNTQGVDVALHGDIVSTSDFHLRLATNLSYSKLKNSTFIDGAPEPVSYNGSTIVQGNRISPFQFYGYESKGVITSEEEAERLDLKNYKGEMFGAGDIEFADLVEDGVINSNDQKPLGTVLPKLFGTMNLHFAYKALSLDVMFSGACGHHIYNSVRREGESMSTFANQLQSVNTRWFADGQNTDMPRAAYGDPMGNGRFSSRWIEDGDYVKLKKAVVSYAWTKNIGFIHRLEVFVQGENLFTWTKYKGLDPEVALNNSVAGLGLDSGKIPNPTNVKLGVNFNF